MVPAVLGQFVSHGTRTAAFEGTLMALAALGAGPGGASAVQWQVQWPVLCFALQSNLCPQYCANCSGSLGLWAMCRGTLICAVESTCWSGQAIDVLCGYMEMVDAGYIVFGVVQSKALDTL